MKHCKKIRLLVNGKIVHARVLSSSARRAASSIKLRGTSSLHGHRQLGKPDPIPESMAGQYIVWSGDGSRIKGHGRTIAEARTMAGPSKGVRWVIQKVPKVRRFRPAEGAAIKRSDAEADAEPAKV